MERRNWKREELILAFNLYCKLPFGSLHSRNPRVIELANIIGRTPGAVALKLSNFASFDPFLQSRGIKGMKNVGKRDREIWEEFTNNWDELIFESETILAKYQNQEVESASETDIDLTSLAGEDKIRRVKTRVNQNFFRQVILNNYLIRCAICNLNIPDLLIAGHIIPWSVNLKERMNPHNGICLCTLHDKAFELGFIGIDTTYRILISTELRKYENESFYKSYFLSFQDKQINLPEKFLPKIEFLEYHLSVKFNK
jgi:putative restriction endonuclease